MTYLRNILRYKNVLKNYENVWIGHYCNKMNIEFKQLYFKIDKKIIHNEIDKNIKNKKENTTTYAYLKNIFFVTFLFYGTYESINLAKNVKSLIEENPKLNNIIDVKISSTKIKFEQFICQLNDNVFKYIKQNVNLNIILNYINEFVFYLLNYTYLFIQVVIKNFTHFLASPLRVNTLLEIKGTKIDAIKKEKNEKEYIKNEQNININYDEKNEDLHKDNIYSDIEDVIHAFEKLENFKIHKNNNNLKIDESDKISLRDVERLQDKNNSYFDSNIKEDETEWCIKSLNEKDKNVGTYENTTNGNKTTSSIAKQNLSLQTDNPEEIMIELEENMQLNEIENMKKGQNGIVNEVLKIKDGKDDLLVIIKNDENIVDKENAQLSKNITNHNTEQKEEGNIIPKNTCDEPIVIPEKKTKTVELEKENETYNTDETVKPINSKKDDIINNDKYIKRILEKEIANFKTDINSLSKEDLQNKIVDMFVNELINEKYKDILLEEEKEVLKKILTIKYNDIFLKKKKKSKKC
ncbi:hypothetical protein YYE_01402 [Plasmodium vinckei vinckei]|nr:hypothetical protein YYE_01402 [Plasmodium vinckei vinckei]